MTKNQLRQQLVKLQDQKYRAFQISLIPTVKPSSILGVRTPELRQIAKQMIKDGSYTQYLEDLNHKYFEENQIHAFIISELKDYDLCIKELTRFLPHVDNWATCDQLSVKIFKKNKDKLIGQITKVWLKSNKIYTIRFGIGMLLQHFLDDDSFEKKYLKLVSNIKSKEYYINMMKAWYFATALAKQYQSSLPFIENQCLDSWTHNKAIQKAIESRRISDEKKEYLKTLKIN